MKKGSCEDCMHYSYDEETDSDYCAVNLDEDEMERFLSRTENACPYYRPGDDYSTARKQ